MALLDIMKKRHSIRKYAGTPVSDEVIEKIVKAGLLAASGKAIYPYDLIVVKNKETLKKMAGCRANTVKMLETCEAAVVVVANEEASDVWIEDCSLVMGQMHLMAAELGVGSCWVQGRLRPASDGRMAEEYLRDILNYPEGYRLEAVLTIGNPDEEKADSEMDEKLMAKVHMETM